MVIKTSKTKTQKTTRTSKTKSKNKGNDNMAWWHLLISALPTIIDGVKTLFSSGDKEKVIAQTPTYNQQTATADDTTKINSLLSELKNQLIMQSESIEDKLTYECEKYIEEIKDILEEMQINVRSIDKISTQNNHKIKNIFREQISQNLSISNKECADILYMSPGEEKQNAITKFKNQVIIKALKLIQQEIKNNFDNVIETAEICISNKLQNENNNISQNLNYLEQIKQVSNVFDKETKLVELQKNITTLEIATNKIKIINT